MKSTDPVLILKHVPSEDAGTLKDFLKNEQIPYRAINLYENESLPKAVDHVRALVIMGGPMNVYEEAKHPFLVKENEFIREALAEGIPCLGICLGAQLIVKALGYKVYKARAKEIGWDKIILTEEAKKDALFSLMTFPFMKVLQWHEDTFDLPNHSVLLASSQQVPHQAFRYKNHVYGLQFHIEVNRSMLEEWFKKSPELAKILEEYDAYRPKLDGISQAIYQKFFQ